MPSNRDFVLLLVLTACLAMPPARGQEPGSRPAEPAPEEESSQEVEVSEDNYRRFMELKDRPVEHAPLPIDAYDPQAALEKMGRLPEASQKHLRNQLREIIVQNDAWQPGDAGTSYPYVPSQAAQSDRALYRQEAEAWTELVGEYHAREAAIHAAAQARRSASPGQPGGAPPPSRQAGAQPRPQYPQMPGQPTPGSQAGAAGGTQAPAQIRATDAGPERAVTAPASVTAAETAPGVAPEDGVTESALDYLIRDCREREGASAAGECADAGEDP